MKVRNITLILLIIVFFVQGCHKTNHKNKIYGSGTIETNEINISAKVIGRIAYLSVKEGQLINKGDLIVKLDELGKSEKDFIRAKKLFSENVISEDQLEQTQKIRDNFIIFSPISGIVILQQLLEGEIVTPGLPIVTLANMNDLWVKIYIPEIDIAESDLDLRQR